MEAADLEILFIRDPKDLPSPLPSSKQIRDTPNNVPGTGDTAYNTSSDAGKRVVVSGSYVVKYGKYVRPLEGLNLLFLEQNLPRIPAPKLYAMWREGEECFLVMEFLAGETLDTLWSTLGDADKDAVAEELREIFLVLHSFPSSGFFGDVTKGPIPYHLFWDPDDDPEVTGPFDAASDMINGLAKKSRANAAISGGTKPSLAEFFERNLAPALEDHQSIFCHSDVQRKNVIVRRKTSSSSSSYVTRLPGEELANADADHAKLNVALIDWEVAGWYPRYWEYSSAFMAFRWDQEDDDWPERVEGFLPVKVPEVAMLRLIYQNVWF